MGRNPQTSLGSISPLPQQPPTPASILSGHSLFQDLKKTKKGAKKGTIQCLWWPVARAGLLSPAEGPVSTGSHRVGGLRMVSSSQWGGHIHPEARTPSSLHPPDGSSLLGVVMGGGIELRRHRVPLTAALVGQVRSLDLF